jgi:hypothetical protein
MVDADRSDSPACHNHSASNLVRDMNHGLGLAGRSMSLELKSAGGGIVVKRQVGV